MVPGKLISTWGRMKLGPYLTPYTKSSSKSVKDLNLQVKIMELLEEYTEEIFMTLNLVSIFWILHQKHR